MHKNCYNNQVNCKSVLIFSLEVKNGSFNCIFIKKSKYSIQ